MTRPKSRPSTQTTSPPSSSVWPSMPWNDTWLRSGRTRLASPPARSAGAPARRDLGACDGRQTRRHRAVIAHAPCHQHASPTSPSRRSARTFIVITAAPRLEGASCRRTGAGHHLTALSRPWASADAAARRDAGSPMPPVRNTRMPCSTVRSGNDTRSGRTDHDVAQIQVIGRHVDRQQRLRARARDRPTNSLRQEPQHRARAPVLDAAPPA